MYAKSLFLITTALVTPATLIRAAEQCVSGSGGYCVNLAAIAQAQGIPGLEFLKQTNDFGELISNIYVFGMGLVAISALVVLVAAGVWYMSAGDNAGRAGEAKKWMGNAIFGLVLALLSWLILYTINPDFVTKPNWVQNLEQINDVPGVDNIQMKSMAKTEFSQVKMDSQAAKDAQTVIVSDPSITKVVVPTDKKGNKVDVMEQNVNERAQSTSKAFKNCNDTDNAAILDTLTGAYKCAQWATGQAQITCQGKTGEQSINNGQTVIKCP